MDSQEIQGELLTVTQAVEVVSVLACEMNAIVARNT